MRTKLLYEMKSVILKQICIDFEDVIYEKYPDEDEDECYEPQVVFNKDGIVATIESELGDVFIDGLSKDEINYIKEVK